MSSLCLDVTEIEGMVRVACQLEADHPEVHHIYKTWTNEYRWPNVKEV